MCMKKLIKSTDKLMQGHYKLVINKQVTSRKKGKYNNDATINFNTNQFFKLLILF